MSKSNKSRNLPRRTKSPEKPKNPRPEVSARRHFGPWSSLSLYSCEERRHRPGKRAKIFCRCLEKKPLFRVEKEGYPRTSSLFALAVAQEIPFGENVPGVAVSDPEMSPGLDHPPPGRGEGDLDKAMRTV